MPRRVSYIAGETIQPQTFVIFDVTADMTVLAAAADALEPYAGVVEPSSRNFDAAAAANIGDNIPVAVFGEFAQLKLAGTPGAIVPGSPIRADTDGTGILAAAGENYAAIATELGAANEVIWVQIVQGLLAP